MCLDSWAQIIKEEVTRLITVPNTSEGICIAESLFTPQFADLIT